jgi:hypothetical protein
MITGMTKHFMFHILWISALIIIIIIIIIDRLGLYLVTNGLHLIISWSDSAMELAAFINRALLITVIIIIIIIIIIVIMNKISEC